LPPPLPAPPDLQHFNPLSQIAVEVSPELQLERHVPPVQEPLVVCDAQQTFPAIGQVPAEEVSPVKQALLQVFPAPVQVPDVAGAQHFFVPQVPLCVSVARQVSLHTSPTPGQTSCEVFGTQQTFPAIGQVSVV
jgi:hypothetical protein